MLKYLIGMCVLLAVVTADSNKAEKAAAAEVDPVPDSDIDFFDLAESAYPEPQFYGGGMYTFNNIITKNIAWILNSLWKIKNVLSTNCLVFIVNFL